MLFCKHYSGTKNQQDLSTDLYIAENKLWPTKVYDPYMFFLKCNLHKLTQLLWILKPKLI